MRRTWGWAAAPVVAMLVFAPGCSSTGGSTRLPASSEGEAGIQRITCAVNGATTRVTATGSFASPLEYQPDAVPPKGTGGWILRLYVRDTGGHLAGFASRPVALGSTRWSIGASLAGGSKPTACDVTIFQSVL